MTPQEKANEILSMMDKAAAFYFINQIRLSKPMFFEEKIYWIDVEDIIKAS